VPLAVAAAAVALLVAAATGTGSALPVAVPVPVQVKAEKTELDRSMIPKKNSAYSFWLLLLRFIYYNYLFSVYFT
jgi:shikimate kinase